MTTNEQFIVDVYDVVGQKAKQQEKDPELAGDSDVQPRVEEQCCNMGHHGSLQDAFIQFKRKRQVSVAVFLEIFQLNLARVYILFLTKYFISTGILFECCTLIHEKRAHGFCCLMAVGLKKNCISITTQI